MPEDDSYEKYLERRAEQLGLPTDPEAYQNGGLAVAATARTLAEAEALAMFLNSRGIPAWVDSPLSAIYSEGYIRHSIAVHVPLGRLVDARKLLAQQEEPASAPEEVDDSLAESNSETEAPPEVAPKGERPLPRTLAGVFFLTFSFCYLTMAVTWTVLPSMNVSAAEHVIEVLAPAVLGVGACAIGMVALRRPRDVA